MNWQTLGYLTVTLLLSSGISFFLAWLLVRHQRQRNLAALYYLLDRMSVLRMDIQRLEEELYLMRTVLDRHGLLDDEEMARLRQELIEIPRQRHAENQQLLEAVDVELKEKLISNFPETMQ